MLDWRPWLLLLRRSLFGFFALSRAVLLLCIVLFSFELCGAVFPYGAALCCSPFAWCAAAVPPPPPVVAFGVVRCSVSCCLVPRFGMGCFVWFAVFSCTVLEGTRDFIFLNRCEML